MAAGTTIQLKRKAGAFTGGQLAAGELGVDTANALVYFSADGSDIHSVSGDSLSQAFTAQTSVVVNHAFGNYPVVEIINGSGAVIVPVSIVHGSVDTFTVTFSVATTGTILATRGGGSGGGGATPEGNIDGGAPGSVYGGLEIIDGGAP
jgi:hypothetical protein